MRCGTRAVTQWISVILGTVAIFVLFVGNLFGYFIAGLTIRTTTTKTYDSSVVYYRSSTGTPFTSKVSLISYYVLTSIAFLVALCGAVAGCVISACCKQQRFLIVPILFFVAGGLDLAGIAVIIAGTFLGFFFGILQFTAFIFLVISGIVGFIATRLPLNMKRNHVYRK